MAKVYTAKELSQRIIAKYGLPEWLTLFELGDAAGFHASRRADAVSIGLWPSRGCEILGFEVKANRADWLHELAEPRKAAAFATLVDRWYIVANRGVIQDGELPVNWGLLQPSGRGLRVIKQAESLGNGGLDRLFLVAILRKTLLIENDSERRRIYRDGFEDGRQAVEDKQARTESTLARDLLSCRESVKIFEAASGVRIDAWNAGRIGKTVRMVLTAPAKVQQVQDQLAFEKERLERLLAGVSELLEG